MAWLTGFLPAGQSAIRFFAQKVFAISAAAPDNPRWRRNAHAAATWPNRFLTTKF
jgi:hypothetical protein